MNIITENFELKQHISKLPLSQQRALLSWLGTQIAKRELEEEFDIPTKPRREVLEIKRTGKFAYQLEAFECSNKYCWCKKPSGKKHTAWYGYQWRKDRVVSWYIGKRLLEEEY